MTNRFSEIQRMISEARRLDGEVKQILISAGIPSEDITTRIKDEEKIRLKMIAKREWDLGDLPDVLGVTVAVRTEEQARERYEQVKAALQVAKAENIREMDRYEYPKPSGYKAITSFWRIDGGMTFEVQTLDDAMLEFREKTHAEYDEQVYGEVRTKREKLGDEIKRALEEAEGIRCEVSRRLETAGLGEDVKLVVKTEEEIRRKLEEEFSVRLKDAGALISIKVSAADNFQAHEKRIRIYSAIVSMGFYYNEGQENDAYFQKEGGLKIGIEIENFKKVELRNLGDNERLSKF